MELDQSIALLQKEQWIREQEEIRQKERDKYDLKKQIKYTLEELIEGVKSGKQFLYALKMEFEPREVFDSGLKLPYIKNFFSVEKEEPDSLFWGCDKRKVSMVIMCISNSRIKQPFKEWVAQSKDALRASNLKVRLLHSKAVGKMEYFCYEAPTSEGVTYNITFRYTKAGKIYVGSYNCMNEDKEGMGLLLEALVHVTEEINQ